MTSRKSLNGRKKGKTPRQTKEPPRAVLDESVWSASAKSPATPPPASTTPPSGAPLDINTATREAIIALPLIGAWSADKIVAYRDANGPFSSIWDLTGTGAVDAWTVQQIQDLITVH